MGTVDVGIYKCCTSKIDATQVRVDDLGVGEVGVGKICAGEIGILEFDVCQVGTTEVAFLTTTSTFEFLEVARLKSITRLTTQRYEAKSIF